MVELLTVIAIVAILAALLSSALNSTKSSAHQITCLNNIKQIQMGWVMYADDNGDVLPLNQSMPSSSPKLFGRRNTTNSWVGGNPKEDVTTAKIERGSIFPYVKNVAVYRCPSDNSKVVGRKTIRRTRSYSMSAYLHGDEVGVNPRVKRRLSELINPSSDRTFVFIEEHEQSVWNGSFHVVPRERFSLASGSWTSTPADRHMQGCNLSFADGHIEHWRWFAPKRGNLDSIQVTGSNELKDLRRLQDCIPRP
jgi:prepilin-type processing-associated H-X9-DG protein